MEFCLFAAAGKKTLVSEGGLWRWEFPDQVLDSFRAWLWSEKDPPVWGEALFPRTLDWPRWIGNMRREREGGLVCVE